MYKAYVVRAIFDPKRLACKNLDCFGELTTFI